MAIKFLITLISFLMMEGIAWFTHKFVMHGLFWNLHKDHHVKENSDSFIEKNDSFFLVFAIPAMILFACWSLFGIWWIFNIAFGITLYGAAYFFVHDVFIHQRIGMLRNTDNRYFRAIRRAHKMHHKHITKEHGESFGMLWVPLKYFRN